MSEEEFLKYITSIGFKYHDYDLIYECGDYKVSIWGEYYNIYNGYEWIRRNNYNDLNPIEKYLKKELRSIKLKQLLIKNV